MSQSTDYSVGQKVIHWIMALLIMLDLFVAQKFGNPMELADRLESRADHASLGTIVTVLFLIRLYLRFRHGAPALPPEMSGWQVMAAKWGHGLLYFLIGFLLVSGVATAVNAAYPISIFGQLDITIGQSNELQFDALRVFHEFATNAIIALIAIHVAAAFYHWVFVKDKVMQKMAKFWSSERVAS